MNYSLCYIFIFGKSTPVQLLFIIVAICYVIVQCRVHVLYSKITENKSVKGIPDCCKNIVKYAATRAQNYTIFNGCNSINVSKNKKKTFCLRS